MEIDKSSWLPVPIPELKEMSGDAILEAIQGWKLDPVPRRVVLNILARKILQLTHFEEKKVENEDSEVSRLIVQVDDVDDSHLCIKQCTELLDYSRKVISRTMKPEDYTYYLYCITVHLDEEIRIKKVREKLKFKIFCVLIPRTLFFVRNKPTPIQLARDKECFKKWQLKYVNSTDYQRIRRLFNEQEQSAILWSKMKSKKK